jgi:hypothetical protein
MTTEDGLSETKITIAVDLGLQNTNVITDLEGDPGGMMTNAAIVTRTVTGRRVRRKVPMARHPKGNLLRMSVTGEPYLSNNLLLVFAPKS